MTNLPTNGRVVVIDDKIEEEALQLIQALGRRGVAVRCFTGRASTLPQSPMSGVRLIFLDLILEGMDFDGDTGDIIKSLKPVLERIIDKKNGPYILVGWTRTPKHLDTLVQSLDPKPLVAIDMDKIECLSDEARIVEKIEAKISEKLESLKALGLLLAWENLVNNAGYITLNQILEHVSDPGQLPNLLYNIARAEIGEKINNVNADEIGKPVLQAFNTLLEDTIEKELYAIKLPRVEDILKDIQPVNEKIAGVVNSKFMISQNTQAQVYPGNVYSEADEKRILEAKKSFHERLEPSKIEKIAKEELQKKQTEVTEINLAQEKEQVEKKFSDEAKYVFVDVTPICDHAQGNSKNHRVAQGFLLKNDHFSQKIMKKSRNDIGFYVSSLIHLDQFNGLFVLVIDFRRVMTLDLGALDGKQPLFRLRSEMLFDIQHRIGVHFTRPGVTSIDIA